MILTWRGFSHHHFRGFRQPGGWSDIAFALQKRARQLLLALPYPLLPCSRPAERGIHAGVSLALRRAIEGTPLSARTTRRNKEQIKSRGKCTNSRKLASPWLRRMRSNRAPYGAAKWCRNCPKGGSHGCETVGCQSTDGLSVNPGAASRSRRAGARRPLQWGGLLFGYSSLGHARESNSLAGSE
jgi:hypothetical protein